MKGCRQSTQKVGERKKMSDTGAMWPMKPGVCSLLFAGGFAALVAVPASRAARGIGTGSSFSSGSPCQHPVSPYPGLGPRKLPDLNVPNL